MMPRSTPTRRAPGSAVASLGPRRLIWYTTAPARSTDCRFVTERSSAAPPDVLDLSHVGLPIAPDNPRYGASGAYRDCVHYYWEDLPNWLICADVTKTPANTDLRYGEITTANLQRHVMRRLTYNPDFAAMVDAMLAFLADPNGQSHPGERAPVREPERRLLSGMPKQAGWPGPPCLP